VGVMESMALDIMRRRGMSWMSCLWWIRLRFIRVWSLRLGVIGGVQYRGVDLGLGLGGVDIRKGWRIGKRWRGRGLFEGDWGFAYIYIYRDVRIDEVLVGVISNGQWRVDLSIRSPYTERRVSTHPSPIDNQYRDGKIASPIVKNLSDVSDNTGRGLIVDFR
jgi:hypothetical protein